MLDMQGKKGGVKFAGMVSVGWWGSGPGSAGQCAEGNAVRVFVCV